MNIQEMERRTGVSKQNIRFYEKEGLIKPVRNSENGYREFSDEDVDRVKLIKMFRKLDFSLSKIQGLLEGQLDLAETVEEHAKELEARNKELQMCIGFCRELKGESAIEAINADDYLKDMEERERKGNRFFDFLSDFKAVYDAELQKSFEFQPDFIIRSKRDFTNALFDYASEHDLVLTITKESMHPEFILDGIEYQAACVYTKWGLTVKCRMKYPEEIEPQYIDKSKRKLYRVLMHMVSTGILLLVIALMLYRDRSPESFAITVLCALVIGVSWIAVMRKY